MQKFTRSGESVLDQMLCRVELAFAFVSSWAKLKRRHETTSIACLAAQVGRRITFSMHRIDPSVA